MRLKNLGLKPQKNVDLIGFLWWENPNLVFEVLDGLWSLWFSRNNFRKSLKILSDSYWNLSVPRLGKNFCQNKQARLVLVLGEAFEILCCCPRWIDIFNWILYICILYIPCIIFFIYIKYVLYIACVWK